MAFDGKYGEITAEKKEFLPGEPLFILRAKDNHAPAGIRAYAEICREHGCSKQHVDECLAHADRLERWQRDNRHLTKQPD